MILKTFAYHKPSQEGLQKIAELREAFSVLATIVSDKCINSREKSAAITKLEECAMWAVKAVVFNDPESQIQE